MRQRILLTAACVFIAIGGIACKEGSREVEKTQKQDSCESRTRQKTNLLPIRVAVQDYYISSSIGYILDENLDEQFGLELIPVLYSSGAEQITDVNENVYDVATIGAAFLYPLIEDQAVLIGEHIQCVEGNGIYVRKNSPILKVRGFNPIYQKVYGNRETVKGCTILMTENTTSQYLGMKWLESIGVKTDAVNIEYMEFDQIYERFTEGYGDIAVLPAPYSYQMEKEGYVEAAGMSSLYMNVYEVILATNQAYKEKTEALEKFLELLLFANSELEADFNLKLNRCGKWYQEHGVSYTEDILEKECRDKIFVTGRNYNIDEFGEFEYKYAEYMAATGNIPPVKLKNVRENVNPELFQKAFDSMKLNKNY